MARLSLPGGMMSTVKAEYFVCRLCGDLLTPATRRETADSEEESIWIHARDPEDQHEADPVVAEREAGCDFCTVERAVWAYEVGDVPFLVAGVTDAGGSFASTNFNETPWGACAICSGLIDDGQWTKLTIRSIRGSEQLVGHSIPVEARVTMKAIQHRFSEVMTGTKVLVVDLDPKDFKIR